MFTDSHCHFFSEYYENIDEIVNKYKSSNISKVITSSTNLNNCKETLEIINKYNSIYGTLGIHPEDIDDIDIQKRKIEILIKENINNKKIVAIGEIGLDYHYDKKSKDRQIELFDFQLSLAEKYKYPVVIHSRDATLDTINCLKKHKCRGVIHCFSGSVETLKIYLKMGYYIGIGGVVTFKNSNLKNVVKEIPLERIILETDSPYLTPEPFRGKKNDPSHIIEIAKYISDIKNISFEELSKITEKNIKDLYMI